MKEKLNKLLDQLEAQQDRLGDLYADADAGEEQFLKCGRCGLFITYQIDECPECGNEDLNWE